MRFHAALRQRLLVVAVVAVVAALATATLAALIRLNTPDPPAPDPVVTPSGQQAALPTAPSPYAYVGEWEGRLAVFRTENAAPETVYDVFIASLPPSEQQALRARIPVANEVELQGLLEDYTG